MKHHWSALEIFYLTFLVNLASSHFLVSTFVSFLSVLIILIWLYWYWKLLSSLFHIVCPFLHTLIRSMTSLSYIIYPNYRLFKLLFEEFSVRIIPRDTPSLESVGPQKCLAFSTDGAKFAIGGEVQICIILISEFCGVLNFLFLLLHSYCLLYMPQMFLTTLLHLKSFFHACFGDYFF